MPISDKTRKVLWGRSGNRCAICRHELVSDATDKDDDSVVGDECHIRSARPNGPRHDSTYAAEKLDAYVNLMLLCRTHHKMVDDQMDTYTTDILLRMKANHETWVSRRLADEHQPQPVRLRRVKENILTVLYRLTTGKEVLDVVSNAMAYEFDHDELRSQEEVDVVGGFLQNAKDCGELSDDLEAGGRVQTAYDLGEILNAVEEAGFFVFGGREGQLLEGGVQTQPSNWPVAIMRVLRNDNQSIMNVDLDHIHDVVAERSKTNPS